MQVRDIRGLTDAIRRQDRIDGFAQGAGIDEVAARFVRMRIVMVIAGANALPHRVGAAAGPRLPPASIELVEQLFRGRLRIAMHRNLDRHLITDLSRLDIDLRNHGAGGNQFAFLGRPLRQARAEGDNAIAIRDQLIGDRRRKAAADAERPRIAGKQSVTADRSRQQRAGALRQGDKVRLGVGNDRAATAENERALRL